MLSLSVAHAAPITVGNFSFETDPANAAGAVNVPTGWTAFNDANFSGTINGNFPGNPPGNLPAPADGTQYFAINEGPSDPTGGIFQDVGALQADTTYTLTVAIGLRSDFGAGSANPGLGSPGIISLINGAGNTGTLLSSTTGAPTVSGTFEDFSTSFTTGASVSGDLTIELSLAPASTFQADFDNVRLDGSAAAVPEPSTYALLGIGLAFAFLVVRRKQISVS